MNKGKPLENKINSWLKELNIHFSRIHDAKSMGMPTATKADFYCFIKPNLIYLECKQVNKSLAFSSIRPSQFKAAKLSETHEYQYIFLIEASQELFAVPWLRLKAFIQNTSKKSITSAEIAKIGLLLGNKQEFFEMLASL